MPNALLEAMALGIPSISTDCKPGGAKEIIDNLKNGLIVERNSVDELERAMEYMIRNQDKAECMGKAAKDICKSHSVDKIIQMWEDYIIKLLSNFES